jgi:uncharacterized protein (TIGR04255 family)
MSGISDHPLPSYETPPVGEVVFGTLFEPLDQMLAPHLGVLWNQFPADFASCEEQPPLPPIVEAACTTPPTILKSNRFPLPRVWLVHRDGQRLIQVQRDRFLFNWRRTKPEDSYPRFDTLFPEFVSHWGIFRRFLADKGLGQLVPRQYEISYINHIVAGDGWAEFEDLASVFPDFTWRRTGRFLPAPTSVNLQAVFPLPDNMGRLHMSIRDARTLADGKPVFMFEVTVKGVPADDSAATFDTWFRTARGWIVRGFTDLTSENMQSQVWRRTQ